MRTTLKIKDLINSIHGWCWATIRVNDITEFEGNIMTVLGKDLAEYEIIILVNTKKGFVIDATPVKEN